MSSMMPSGKLGALVFETKMRRQTLDLYRVSGMDRNCAPADDHDRVGIDGPLDEVEPDPARLRVDRDRVKLDTKVVGRL